MTNTNMTEIINAFAKQAKVSKAKLAEFAQAVQAAPAGTHITADKSARIRKAIMSQKKEFVSADIARQLGVTTVDVNNNLFSLHRKDIVIDTGKRRATGGRGKPAILWKLA